MSTETKDTTKTPVPAQTQSVDDEIKQLQLANLRLEKEAKELLNNLERWEGKLETCKYTSQEYETYKNLWFSAAGGDDAAVYALLDWQIDNPPPSHWFQGKEVIDQINLARKQRGLPLFNDPELVCISDIKGRQDAKKETLWDYHP